jgi:hypothetical protein
VPISATSRNKPPVAGTVPPGPFSGAASRGHSQFPSRQLGWAVTIVSALTLICATTWASELPQALVTSTSPDSIGQFGPVIPLPVVPIHMHLLLTGKVRLWDRHDHLLGWDGTPRIWDPQNDDALIGTIARCSRRPCCQLAKPTTFKNTE